MQAETTASNSELPPTTIENAVEQAKRAFALKKYEQAVDHYATALELATAKFGEEAPEVADLYFVYGKALLENAIAQNSVLGKEKAEEAEQGAEDASKTVGNAPILSFSGDAEEAEDSAVDLFAQQEEQHSNDEHEDGEGEGEGEDGEPEDDFNAAWNMLELARSIYAEEVHKNDDDDEIKLKLADTYITLGDVSLETEKFDQAINDYEAGLKLKLDLLPVSSRQIAEAHYKLSMVLDLTPGKLSDAIVHAEKALESIEQRLAELRDGLSGQLPPAPKSEVKNGDKGKGKGKATMRIITDLVQNMSKTQIEGEMKELVELRDDLAQKVEELKTTPSETTDMSAPALAARALDEELNAGPTPKLTSSAVNDLTSMVVKKKKAPGDSNASKRKADADMEAEASSSEKKVKLDAPES